MVAGGFHAQRRPLPGTPPTSRDETPNRGSKGWWASGVRKGIDSSSLEWKGLILFLFYFLYLFLFSFSPGDIRNEE